MLAMLLALLATAPLQTTWTVDDNGPADFADIQPAIDAASNGDLVLIQAGTYKHFALTKDLRLIGATGESPCHVGGFSIVSNVGDFALVGLQFDRLRVIGIMGEGLLDDCKVGPFNTATTAPPALLVEATSQLTVQRTNINGGSAESESFSEAGIGAEVDDSGVVFVGCKIRGQDGSCFLDGDSDGAVGLLIRLGSEVLLASTSVTGGNSDTPGLSTCSGGPANAVHVNASTLVVRGDAGDKLSAGYDATLTAQHADAISAYASNVVWSGVTIALGDAAGVQPAQPEPFATVDGGMAPGHAASIGISGPPGTLGWLLLSGAAGDVSLPAWEAHLWLDPAHVVLGLPFVTTGQFTPVQLMGTLPHDPLLTGIILRGQVAFPGVASTVAPGTKLMGNPFAIPLRF